MSELVRFLSGDNDVAQKTQMDPQNPTAKFVPLEPGQVLFGLEVVEDGSLLGTIYYDYKDKNGIITRVSMGNGGAGGSGGGGGIIKTLATTDGKHESDEVTAIANTIIPLPKKIFANLLSAKTQFNFPKVHDPSNTAYVNEDAAPGQSYLYGNGLHMINPFNTLQDSWIRTIGKSGSAEATLELAMRDNASNEYIYDQIVARHYKADGTIVTDTDGHKREVVILGKEGESQFPGPVTSQRGFVGDVDGNAKSATKAKQDWYDQVIDSTYLSKIVKTTHNGSKFEITSYDGRYTPVGSADAKKDVITIPGATTTLAGLVTTGDQTITGNKTINSSGTLTIMKQGGFIYSGIQEDKATNKNLPIWFSTGTVNGTPNYSTELTYNPSTGTVTAKKFAGPATSATYDAEGGAIHDKYLKRAGGTMTGALKFADNTYNAFGDDIEIGSQNAKGKLNIHGKNGATGIVFVPYSGTTSQTISIDGAGVMTITGSLKTTLDGNASTATTLKTARNFNITDSSAAYSGPNVSFNGSADVTLHMPDTFAGTLKGNADTATKLATARTLWGQSFNGTANISGNMSSVGNVLSTKTNTYTIGSSSNVWKAIYATAFYGALSGNASSATKLETARSFHITDSSATYNGASVTFDGTGDITLHMPDTFAGTLKGNADSATKLKTARTLWGQSFNGSANVTGAMSNVGNITSLKTNTHDIGSSSNVWKNVYATTFHGALDGKATSAGSADMANQVTHVLTIEGQSYDGSTDVAVGNTVFYIVGNSTDTTAGTWTGTDSKIKRYYNGLTIIYVPKVDGASTTTLNLNGLGAKTCYYSNTSKLTTHFAKGTPILLTYIDGYWRRADYDSNTNTQLRVYRQKTSNSAYNKEYPLLVSRTQASGIGTADSDGSYTSIYGVMNNDTAKIPTLNVHTGAITATSFKGTASNAINDVNGAKIDETYLKKSGGTMTGALNFANGTYNKMGDDVEIGDKNTAGKLYIHGLNGPTGIVFAPYSGSTSQTLSIDGAGVMTITGTLKATLSGNASTATTLQTARNFHITDSSATYNGPNASFNGSADVTLHMPSTFAGTLKGNADSATIARSLGADNGMKMYAHNSNEINFGGTNTSTTLYFGYRATDSRPIPTKFVFGGSTGTATLVAATFQGALSGNATTATTLKTARKFHITDSSATYNGPNASFNGSADITLHMPSTFAGALKGNADTATNADKLDGYHRKGLYTSPGAWINANEYTKTVTVEGDANTYYPVVITTTSEKEAINYISVWKNLGSKTAAYSSGNHSNGTSSMWLIYEARNWFWDGNGGYLKCWYRSMPYANLCAKAEAAGSGVGALVVYLRGGGTTYNISTTYAATVTVYLASTNIGSSSSPVNVAPTTSNGNLGKLSTVVLGYGNLDGNAGTATKWQTARNFQVDLALDNPATVKVDGTKDVILPVTGILATKHGGTGNSSHTANRLVWTETATKLTSGYHYADTTHVGVNTTTKPSQNFYVTGTSYLNGDTTINGQLYMALSNAAITWNQGSYWQRMITEDDSASGTHIFKFQVSSNSGSSWTDILRLANNGQVRVQNNVGGIYKLQTTASTVAAVQVISDNQDSSIFKVCNGTAFTDSWSCGFDLVYNGTGADVNNLLTLYAGNYPNTTGRVVGWSVNQAGQMGIRTTPSTSYALNINGNTHTNGIVYINNSTEAGKDNAGALIVGPTGGVNLGIDSNEITARNNKAVSTLYLNPHGGLVQIGSGGLYVTGQMKTNGPLLIGSDANGRTKNYIAFYGITGDGPDTWNHTFIGENLFGDTDKSELILFKGNDPGSTPEDMRYASGPGPDRIRHIAAGHLFQIYRTALSGTFATIAQSTVPISIFEVNQQGVVVYNEGTDANNYPAKITFKVKDTVHGTTSTATIAAYSDHGTASYGSNLVISSGGNTLIQAGDGAYGSYANLIGTGVNQGENLYLTADSSIQLCAAADTANRKLIWDGTTFYPSISNTFHLGGKSYRWASAHVYRDFNIYGTGSTGDESHVRFNASDNSQRAIIAFNGNTTNTLDATTHLKIATNYGDIRLDAASNYINVKGHILPRADFTATNYNIGSTTRRWGNVYANALRLQGPSSDPSEAQGARIEFAFDNGGNRSQPVYISYTPNDSYRAPYGLKIFGTEATNYGAWLEVQGAIGTSSTNLASGIGISLYGGPKNGKPEQGIFYGATGTFGQLKNTTSAAYGVTTNAMYLTVADVLTHGWLFMRGATNVAGITGNGTFLSVVSTGTHIAGNQGKVIIDGTAGAGYNMLFRQKSTNGVFTGGAHNAEWNLYYTADSVIKKGTNGTTYNIRLMNEAGNTRLNRLGINGENTSYQLYVNGKSYFNGVIATNSQISSSVATGTPPFVIASTTVNANLNADLLDGFHESKFLRHRDTVSGSGGTSHSNSLWAQIGIRQYNNALPDAIGDNATYAYGAVVSLPSENARLDLWYNHLTSSNGDGLRYRTGWNNDKRTWATIIDNLNYSTHLDGRYVNVTGDTMTGNLTINATLLMGSNLRLWSDGEGGNIRLITPGNSNNVFELDTCGNELRLYYSTNGGAGLSQGWYFKTNGVFQTPKMQLSAVGTWATTVNYANSLINFGTRFNNQSSGTLYYFPWMGGYDGVNGAGYYNTVTMGLYHGVPSNAGFFIGMSWDGNNANTFYYFSRTGDFTAPRVRNAVWNDYAECRAASTEEPGRVVIETSTGIMRKSTDRLQAGASVVSDTYGTLMGETELCKTPIAVAGRVLVYTHEDRDSYPLGAAVCTGPNGTVSLMTREEVREYPERIVGTVSEIPKYETWGTGNVKVNGRIWIKVR